MTLRIHNKLLYSFFSLLKFIDEKVKLVEWMKPSDEQNKNGILLFIQHTHDKVILVIFVF